MKHFFRVLAGVIPPLTVALAAPMARADGCIPGAQTECACADGKRSVQVCAPSGDRLEACQCGQAPPVAAPPAAASEAPASTTAPAPADLRAAEPEPEAPAPSRKDPGEVAIDPRTFTEWSQIPAYPAGNGEYEPEDYEMKTGLVVAGGSLAGVGTLLLVVGGVIRATVPRELICRSSACGASTDDLLPNMLLGLGGASLVAGAVLLPIGLAPVLRSKRADTPQDAAAKLIPSHVGVAPTGGEVTWTF